MSEYINNRKSIKYHVNKYLHENKERLTGKKIVDVPAGNGITSEILAQLGANPVAFDLFPEYFNREGLECKRANVMDGLPLQDASVDMVICQEGIEHFTDQFKTFKEFNRILKKNGSLIITTPNYSGLRARLSYFLSESERFNSIMPPNEIDSIWMNEQSISNEVYFGHVFLIGIQKLRVLAKLAGFKIKHIQFTRLKTTSLLIFIFTYPFILLSNWITYRKNIKKDKGYSVDYQKEVYKEIFRLAINPKILLDGHLFVEFEKISNYDQVMSEARSIHKKFDLT